MKTAVVLFVAGVLFFAGCLGEAPAAPGAPRQNVSAGQPSAPAQLPAQPQGQSLSGLGFAQLVALGMPVRCAVSTTEGGRTITSNLWLKGGSFRAESAAPGTTESFVTIVRGSETFFQMNAQMKQAFAAMGKSCDWLRMTQQEVAQPPAASGIETTSASELESIPPTNYQCNPDVFGDEKFATPGSVCDYASVFGGLTPPSAPGGAGNVQQCLSACAMLPADQQAGCQQACAGG